MLAAAGMGAAALVAGCGLLQPVDIPSSNRLFTPLPPKTAASAASADAAKACAVNDDYEGPLGQAICRADLRRLDLMKQAAAVTNNTANFNALSWPLGSATLLYKLRDPSRSLLVPAAVAAGLYGFLNAGIPGRDAANREAAKGLTCAIIESSSELYARNDEFKPPGDEGGGLRIALQRLDSEIIDFEVRAGTVLGSLRTRGSSPRAQDSIGRALGIGSSGGAARDTRPDIERYVRERLRLARRTSAEGDRLRQLVTSGSAARLNSTWVAIEARREAELARNAPALRDPLEEAKKIVAFSAALTAQSGTARDGGKPPSFDARDAWLPSALTHPLTASSNREWQNLMKVENRTLQHAITDVRRWLDDHRARREQVEATKRAIGCPSETVAVVAVQPAASDAARSGRGPSALPEGVASGTPLPTAGEAR